MGAGQGAAVAINQIPCVEMVALMALADLERLEGPWMTLMESKDPESVAVAYRLLLAHLTQTTKRIQMAGVIQAAEQMTNRWGAEGSRKVPEN